MAYTDFIAAIDLGSSHMVGMVGAKGPAGTLSIIAYEVENSDTCIRRGCVYNIKDAAGKIVRLIRKLETNWVVPVSVRYMSGWEVSRFVRLTMPCRKCSVAVR